MVSVVTGHAWMRINERLKDERIQFTPRVAARVEDAARVARGSRAMLLTRLPKSVGTYDTSNGDEVWAIIREARVVTIMLRRSTQRTDCGTLDVDTVDGNPAFDWRELREGV